MAFTVTAMCDTFKREILAAEHDFTNGTGHTFTMALYDNSATLTATTAVYTATGELADATGNYSRPGKTLVNVTPTLNGTQGITDFDDAVWSTATFSAYGALIYNNTHATDAAVAVLDFGGVKTATAGDFTVQFPVAATGTAIIRIA